jgi:hypothetical protein
MTVTVGLDVHARSIRLAAVRADELLEERTLPYDEGAVERLLRRWPGALVAGHWSSWQAARVEVTQDNEAKKLERNPVEDRVVRKIVDDTEVQAAQA